MSWHKQKSRTFGETQCFFPCNSNCPYSPRETKLINDFIGFSEQDGFVYYLHSGSPVYCHKKDDKESYRHTLASLVVNNLCTTGELSEALGINRKNVERYVKTYRGHGPGYFFNRPDGRGRRGGKPSP